MQTHPTLDFCLLILTSVLLPIALACGLAHVGRRVHPDAPARLRRWTLVAALGGAVAFVSVGAAFERLAPWELVQAAGLFGVCMLVTLPGRSRVVHRAVAFVAVAAIVLLGGELVARLVARPDPRLPIEPGASLIEPEHPCSYCAMLFPDPGEYRFSEAQRVAEGARTVVLHVGDSMLGEIHQPNFVAMLDRDDSEVAQVHAGRPGTGPDFAARIVRDWGRELEVDAVVYYPYPRNDLDELGRRFVCCDRGPLFDLDGQTAVPLCEEPDWSTDFALRLSRGRPPYLIRVAATRSRLAAVTLTALLRASNAIERPLADVDSRSDEAERRYRVAAAEVVRAADALGVPLLVVPLPFRTEVERAVDPSLVPEGAWTGPVPPPRIAFDTFRQLGVTTVDPLPAIEAGVRERDPDMWVGQREGTHWDEHYGEAGHRRMAELLRPHIAELTADLQER